MKKFRPIKSFTKKDVFEWILHHFEEYPSPIFQCFLVDDWVYDRLRSSQFNEDDSLSVFLDEDKHGAMLSIEHNLGIAYFMKDE